MLDELKAQAAAMPPSLSPTLAQFHDWISTSAREVTVAGVVADLTRIEFDLLDVLSANPKVVYNRQQLLDRVWGPGWFGDDHVVDVHIANLRKKIDQPGTKSLVRTVRGVGYSMGG